LKLVLGLLKSRRLYIPAPWQFNMFCQLHLYADACKNEMWGGSHFRRKSVSWGGTRRSRYLCFGCGYAGTRECWNHRHARRSGWVAPLHHERL